MKNDEGSVMMKQRVVGEVKRQKGNTKVGGSVTVGVDYQGEEEIFVFVFLESSEKKSLKKKRRDKK